MPRNWREQQGQDRYFRKAHAEGYRARSAYKLIEIDRKFKLFKPGQRVLDLGAAPGSWSQVAAKEVGEKGRVVAVDLTAMEPVRGLEILQADVRDPGLGDRLLERLGGEADLVLSDMAPNTSGIAETDYARSLELAEAAQGLAAKLLRGGGSLVVKVFEGPDLSAWLAQLRKHYRSVRLYNPEASRRESRETFVVALHKGKG